MKKMLFWAILSLISVSAFAAQEVISACYSVDSHGRVGLKIVSASGSLSGLYVWLADGSFYTPCPFISGSVVLDDDGLNWDYSYSTGTYIPLSDLTDPSFKMPCYTIYYSTGGGTPPNLPAVQACPCQPFTSGCFTEDGYGNYHIKLVFTTAYYLASGGNTPALIGGPYGYMVFTSQSDPAGDINHWVHEDDHYAAYYTIPASYFTPDANGCITIQYELLMFDLGIGGGETASPDTWPVTQSVQICPCCASTSVSIAAKSSSSGAWLTQEFTSTMIAHWDFGDGSTGYGLGVSHTYAGAGTYTVCATSINANNTQCRICHAFCLTPPQSFGSSTFGTPCDANFLVSVLPGGGGHIAVFNGISTGPGTTFDYDFGDGSGPASGTSGYMTHTYAASGSYMICVAVTPPPGSSITGCYRCMTVCVDALGPKPGSATPPLQPLAESVVIAPNPAENTASILFDLDKAADVRVIITDALGKVVTDFTNTAITAGRQHIYINTSGFPTGVYNVSVKTDKGSTTKRLSVLR